VVGGGAAGGGGGAGEPGHLVGWVGIVVSSGSGRLVYRECGGAQGDLSGQCRVYRVNLFEEVGTWELSQQTLANQRRAEPTRVFLAQGLREKPRFY